MTETIVREFVLGFCFDKSRQCVVLIRKARPQWMAGLLNGIGGKLEPGEDPVQAMAREFEEETGVATYPALWDQFLVMTEHPARGVLHEIYVFRYWSDLTAVQMPVFFDCSPTDEPIEVHALKYLREARGCLPNLSWLLPMAAFVNQGSPALAVESTLKKDVPSASPLYVPLP